MALTLDGAGNDPRPTDPDSWPYGLSIDRVLDLESWKPDAHLSAMYAELQQYVDEARRREEMARPIVRDFLFDGITRSPRADSRTGVNKLTPARIEQAHRAFLFNGATEACDATSDICDTLPLVVTQVGVTLTSYSGQNHTWLQRLFRMDLPPKITDPVQDLQDLLTVRRRRGSVGARGDGNISELARRGVQAYAERAILLNYSDAPWRMGHGNPVPYELITGFWATHPRMMDATIEVTRGLLDHQRFVYVPTSIPAVYKTLANALEALEYVVLWSITDDLARIVQNGRYAKAMLPKVTAFVEEVGPEIVMGLYRATPHAPAQAFWAHREHVHTAAAIAVADSVLSDHRGFPVLLEVADRMASAAFGGARLATTVQAAYASTDAPFRYLGERDTRG